MAAFVRKYLKHYSVCLERKGHSGPKQVLSAIRTWARGEIQDDARDLSEMSQPTISLVCKQVALALVAHRDQWIKMPQSDIEQNKVIAEFYSICGFRQERIQFYKCISCVKC
ncbi:unnamed protein product, partial [Brenthis ino]